MGTDKQGGLLSPMEIDAIGEVLNISMGSAATAVSSMLDKQVVITTPNVEVASLGSIDSGRLEPAVLVKITYTEGIWFQCYDLPPAGYPDDPQWLDGD